MLRSASRIYKNSNNYFSSMGDDMLLSSHQVSRLLQVSPSTVVAWINQGKLEASRTPGGHRRVKVGDLRRFLVASGMDLPPGLAAPEPARRVFVVDDDPMVLRAIRRAVAQLGDSSIEVDGCEDGIRALVLIGAIQPDLVLLDIYMQGVDGFEVCRRLRQVPHLEKLKVVAITAYPSEEARARILDHGACDYWVKPVTGEQIAALLDSDVAAVAESR